MNDTATIIDQFNAAFGERAPVNLMRVRDGKIVEALGYGKRP